MHSTVDYVKVVDLLTDTIKELNQPCVEAVRATPAAPVERTAEERKQDTAIVLRELLHALEHGTDAGAAAAAEHSASDNEAGRGLHDPTAANTWNSANKSYSSSAKVEQQQNAAREEAEKKRREEWAKAFETMFGGDAFKNLAGLSG